jgi:hypothetical protein
MIRTMRYRATVLAIIASTCALDAQSAPAWQLRQPANSRAPGLAWATAGGVVNDSVFAVVIGSEASLQFVSVRGRVGESVRIERSASGSVPYISWIGTCGRGKLAALSFGTDELLEIAPGGTVLERRKLLIGPRKLGPSLVACDDAEAIVALSRPDFVNRPNAIPSQGEPVRVAGLLSVGSLSSASRTVRPVVSGTFTITAQGAFVALPGAAQPRIAVGSSLVAFASGDSAAVVLFDSSGTELVTRALPFTEAPHSALTKAWHLSRATEFVQDSSSRTAIARSLARVSFARAQPIVRGLWISARSRIWVDGCCRSDGRSALALLDPKGTVKTTITLPIGASVLAIGPTQYVVRRWSEGREVVEGYWLPAPLR